MTNLNQKQTQSSQNQKQTQSSNVTVNLPGNQESKDSNKMWTFGGGSIIAAVIAGSIALWIYYQGNPASKKVYGLITDTQGAPVGGAHVTTVIDKGSSSDFYSDSAGKFHVEVPEQAKTLRIHVKAEHYLAYDDDLDPHQQSSLDVRLKADVSSVPISTIKPDLKPKLLMPVPLASYQPRNQTSTPGTSSDLLSNRNLVAPSPPPSGLAESLQTAKARSIAAAEYWENIRRDMASQGHDLRPEIKIELREVQMSSNRCSTYFQSSLWAETSDCVRKLNDSLDKLDLYK